MKLIITLSLLLAVFTLSAQTLPDTILIKSRDYIYQGENLSATALRKLIKSNPSTRSDLNNARLNSVVAGIFSVTGTALVALSARDLVMSNQFNAPLTFTGVAFFVFAIPFSYNSDRYTRRAIKTYNRGVLRPEISDNLPPSVNLRIGSTGDGIGLIVSF